MGMKGRYPQSVTGLILFVVILATNAMAGNLLHGPTKDDIQATPGEGAIVVYRRDGTPGHIPAVFINESVVGTLLPNEYARAKVCKSDIALRIASRGDVVAKGSTQTIDFADGYTTYIEVVETEQGAFEGRAVDAAEALQALQGITHASNIVNRFIPKIVLGADGLFAFNSDVLLPSVRERLDKLSRDINLCASQITRIKVIGHTDRIGSDTYNKDLSWRRAKAVGDYLAGHGVNVPIDMEGRGSKEPVTSGCEDMNRDALIECLQPDRRVVVELRQDGAR
jgi:outer membrane protein OmpA-like peptidoglycan-associated protein